MLAAAHSTRRVQCARRRERAVAGIEINRAADILDALRQDDAAHVYDARGDTVGGTCGHRDIGAGQQSRVDGRRARVHIALRRKRHETVAGKIDREFVRSAQRDRAELRIDGARVRDIRRDESDHAA